MDYFDINEKLKARFERGEEYVIGDIIGTLKELDPLAVKSVITQGIMNNCYLLVENRVPFVNSTIRIESHQEYTCTKKRGGGGTAIALSIPPFHKSTLGITLVEEAISYVTLEDLFLEMMKNAGSSIKICSPFFDLRGLTEMQNLLIRKAGEGVEVSVLTRLGCDDSVRRQSLRRYTRRLSSARARDNFTCKVYHFENENKRVLSSIHAKIIIVDGEQAYIGSGEIRRNSFERNFEAGLVLEDKDTVKQVESIFDTLFSISVGF